MIHQVFLLYLFNPSLFPPLSPVFFFFLPLPISSFSPFPIRSDNLRTQLQLSVIKAGKAEAARTAAEDQVAEASKESIMLNLEIKEIKSQHKMETTRLENVISSLEDQNTYAMREQVSDAFR